MQSTAPEAVDLSSESAETKRLYGLDDPRTERFGRRCLMARRLVERGVRFVQVYSGGGHNDENWDAHGDVNKNHELHCGETDQPIAALLTDLKRRGLLDETLVVWTGEFGRTPTGQNGKGRDHSPRGFTAWLAGGGVKGGQTYGATDDFGYAAVENKVHVHDLHATILHLLGFDHRLLTYFHGGRDMRLTDVSRAGRARIACMIKATSLDPLSRPARATRQRDLRRRRLRTGRARADRALPGRAPTWSGTTRTESFACPPTSIGCARARCSPTRRSKIVFENDAIAVVDGQFGFGQVMGEEAMKLGIDKARRQGVAVVALRNSGHLGRIGDWAEMAAAAGQVSLHFVNTSGGGILVAPFGGTQRRLSANPIAAGVPVKNGPPIIVDISTCTIAEGKIKVAFNKGVKVPEGCILDSEGQPTNDPKAFYATPPGAILPSAGTRAMA